MSEGEIHAGTRKFLAGLDKPLEFYYNTLAIGVWRSLVSRLVRVQEASGSNPDTPTKKSLTAFAVRRFLIVLGFEEGGRHDFVGKKYAGGIFFSPGENPFSLERTQYGCGQEEI